MNDFDEVVKEADRAKKQLSPATIERNNLKPVRDEAEQLLKDLRETIRWAGPRIAECSQRLQDAKRHGVRHITMEHHLTEAAEMAMGGPVTLQTLIIDKIDNLTEFDVYHRIHIRIPGRLPSARMLAGEIRRLVELAEGQDTEELTEMLRNRVGAPRGAVAVYTNERDNEIKVVTNFKV